jgi:alpha-tubulin suppressor-like RCC1 family protein
VVVGGTVPRVAKVLDGAGQVNANAPITWTSDNAGIATVAPTGVVTGVGPGTTTIRATSGTLVAGAVVMVAQLRFATLPAVNAHNCGLTDGGDLYCWGAVSSGESGPGSPAEVESCPGAAPTSCFSTPRKLATASRFASVVTGISHSCGLTATGEAHCWGDNSEGQLGAPTTQSCFGAPCSSTPLAVGGGLRFISLDAIQLHTCGLTSDGTAWCWGSNSHGQLGAPALNAGFSAVPVRAAEGIVFSSIATGSRHTCGIAVDGTTWCWGRNLSGELGSARAPGPVPSVVEGSIAFRSISAGDRHVCGLTDSGAAYCWGGANVGQLGDGDLHPFDLVTTPVAVSGGHLFLSISAGHQYTCGIAAGGAGWCWGQNLHGNLGLGRYDVGPCAGETPCNLTPQPVAGGLRFGSLKAGQQVTCGITTEGWAYCWGRNTGGQLGDGRGTTDGADQSMPVGVAGRP